jgi:predicted metalloprotease with PDZ domain
LKDVVFSLAKKYGSDKPFDDDTFIAEFVAQVHPDLQMFFDKYIIGTTPLDVAGGLETIGVIYKEKYSARLPLDLIWNNDVKYPIPIPPTANPLYYIKKVGDEDFVGFQIGDKVSRKDIFLAMHTENGDFVQEGNVVTLPVLRDGKKINIEFKAQYGDKTWKLYLKNKTTKTPEQQKMYNRFISSDQGILSLKEAEF